MPLCRGARNTTLMCTKLSSLKTSGGFSCLGEGGGVVGYTVSDVFLTRFGISTETKNTIKLWSTISIKEGMKIHK